MPRRPDSSNDAPDGMGKRKRPVQNRSRNTVECIKQAALAILKSQSVTGASTAAIAEKAGISIGSLYQYFASRDAILFSLYEDLSMSSAHAMQRLSMRIMDLPLEKAIRTATRQILGIHIENKVVLIDLVDEMSHLELPMHPLSYDNQARSSIRAFVASRNAKASIAAIDRTVFFLERAIMGSIRAYLRDPPPGMSQKALIDGVTDMALAAILRLQSTGR